MHLNGRRVGEIDKKYQNYIERNPLRISHPEWFHTQTVLTEIEAILKSRPLTYSNDDSNDLEPLTPNHFLSGRSSEKPFASLNYDIRSAPQQKWKQVQSMSNQFWDKKKEFVCFLGAKKMPSLLPGHEENALCASWARRKRLVCFLGKKKMTHTGINIRIDEKVHTSCFIQLYELSTFINYCYGR